MPRKARIVEPGTPMHITQRGMYRQNIFLSDDDKAFYLKSFMKCKRKFKVKVYAWCLMDNHIHFIVEPQSRKAIGKLFHCLNTKYVSYFNRVHERFGKLFGDRCYSCLLDDDHLYEAVRYIELNPYRAKMESKVATYQWTSARERLGLIKTRFLSNLDDYFTVDNWLGYLSEVIDDFTQEVKRTWQTIKRHTQRGIPVGNPDFLKRIEKQIKRTFSFKFRRSKTWQS